MSFYEFDENVQNFNVKLLNSISEGASWRANVDITQGFKLLTLLARQNNDTNTE